MQNEPDLLNEICGASHDVSQAREALEKALCVLAVYASTDYSKLLMVVQDYIMEANGKWLRSAERHLDQLRAEKKEDVH